VIDSTMEVMTSTLLNSAKAASMRRGSLVVREIDVLSAISSFKQTPTPKWYLIPVAGNGACLCEFLCVSPRIVH
jgi:hypothetical protein